MTNLAKPQKNLKVLYSIEALGVQSVKAGAIRVESLHERLKPRVDFPHRHDFYQLTFVTQGQGWHEIDFKRYKINGRKIFFMKTSQVHSWFFKKGAQGFVIEFTRESLPSLSAKSLFLLQQISQIEDVITFKKESDWNFFETTCSLMLQEFSQKRDHFESSLEGFLQSLLVYLFRCSKKGALHNTSTLVEKFQNLVNQNYASEHKVSFYAIKLNMTPKALTMQIKRSLNKSPRQVIQDRLSLESKRLLSYSDLSVSEIGYELGFNDANYFTRFFTKAAKVSPAKFREKIKDQN